MYTIVFSNPSKRDCIPSSNPSVVYCSDQMYKTNCNTITNLQYYITCTNISCYDCNEKIQCTTSLKKHIKSNKGTSCHSCNNNFQYITHLNKHDDDRTAFCCKIFSCYTCNDKMLSTTSLNKHIELTETTSCYYCNNNFQVHNKLE